MQTFLAYGKFSGPGVFDAQCSDCLDCIGTMAFSDLLRAVEASKDVGGIKCPKCRKTSCYFCGLQLGEIKYPSKHIGRVMRGGYDDPELTDYVEICKLCYCDNWEKVTDEIPF